VASDGATPDPGLVLRELIDLRLQGNVSALARRLAGDGATKDEVEMWRNYINRWKRERGHPNRHDPTPEHLERLAGALGEPLALLQVLYDRDSLLERIEQIESEVRAVLRSAGR
jgi:transcriptional regulator with XRE-family HTH domain